MQYLWAKEIEEVKNTGYLKSDISITDALIENFYNEIMVPEDAHLMEIIFSKNPKQEDLDNLLKEWDIEVKNAAKTLLLGYFMKNNPDLHLTDYETPRIQGLMKNIRFKNMAVISHFSKIGKALNNKGIIPMILKGGAMRFLRPELPRIMGDVDILVPEKDFDKSAKIAESLGYWYTVDVHSIDLHEQGKEKGTLDIHKYLSLGTKDEPKILRDIFKRATKHNVFGVETYVPCHEDLMFITLTNLAKNLRKKTSQAGLLFALFDCKFFMEDKKDFNWNIVRENAIKSGAEFQVNFAIKYINRISKDFISKEIQEKFLFEKEMNEYSNMVMYTRFYLEDIRNESRAMKIQEVIKHPSVWGKYIVVKLKYISLKMLKTHPKLIELLIKDLKTKQYNIEQE